MAKLNCIYYANSKQEFEDLYPASSKGCAPSLKQFVTESQYRRAETGAEFEDLSSLICVNGKVIALICAHKYGDFIGFNGSGAQIFYFSEDVLSTKQLNKVVNALVEEAAKYNIDLVKIRDVNLQNTLSDLGLHCYSIKANPHIKMAAVQDLEQAEEDLHKQLRQSYKSLVNQGNKEIDFIYLNKGNADKVLFDQFFEFHKKVAGRQTRPTESWDCQYEMILNGDAELALGYMDDHGLVSSALFTDYGHTTSYAVAVYDRDLFDKPLAHANVYNGMIRAKKRGQKFFNLGILPAYSHQEKKAYNIGKFKKGFCRNLQGFIEWNISVNAD